MVLVGGNSKFEYRLNISHLSIPVIILDGKNVKLNIYTSLKLF